MGQDDWRKLLCPKCKQLKKTCTCQAESQAPSKSTVVRVGRETKGRRGKFYMTYSAMNQASDPPRLLIALAVSDRPDGPYRDLHAPWFDLGYSAIDGDLARQRNGTIW